MNNKNMKKGLTTLLALSGISLIASAVQAAEGDTTESAASFDAAKLGAGIALGLAGVGTGLSQGPIGAAAVGMPWPRLCRLPMFLHCSYAQSHTPRVRQSGRERLCNCSAYCH